jgi:putative transposase
MAEKDLDEIRDCTNKSWVLGDERFKVKVEAKTGISSQRVGQGGDRKSEKYREGKNQSL